MRSWHRTQLATGMASVSHAWRALGSAGRDLVPSAGYIAPSALGTIFLRAPVVRSPCGSSSGARLSQIGLAIRRLVEADATQCALNKLHSARQWHRSLELRIVEGLRLHVDEPGVGRTGLAQGR